MKFRYVRRITREMGDNHLVIKESMLIHLQEHDDLNLSVVAKALDKNLEDCKRRLKDKTLLIGNMIVGYGDYVLVTEGKCIVPPIECIEFLMSIGEECAF